MGGCHWCEKFNSTWTRLVKQYGNKFIMKKIDGPSNEKLMKQYNIDSFPTLILSSGKSFKKYEGDRSIQDIKQFLK